MKNKPKKCPFCGKKVKISKDLLINSWCFYHDIGVKCSILGGAIHIEAETEEKAIEKWNRRVEA